MKKSDMQAFVDSLVVLRDIATDEQALAAVNVYPEWMVGREYVVNERLKYKGILYNVLQEHTSQSTWSPDIAASLYAKVLIPDPTIIPEWEQPESTNPYMTGDKVTHKGKTWISTIDNNVWEPGVHGWQEYAA